MAKNVILGKKAASEIDALVSKLIADIGDPEPPLHLELVRDLLRLDRGYYTAVNPGILRKMTSRMRVGALQVFERPGLLIEAVKKLDLRGLWIPDGRRILIDQSLPKPKHRWIEAHEVGHSLIPWHSEVLFGDNQQTLTPECHDEVESEANFAASRLLFLQDRFTAEAQDCTPTIGAARNLKTRYGNTITTTLLHCVSAWGQQKSIVGVVSGHPHPSKRGKEFDWKKPCRHVIQSPAFAQKFSSVSEADLFTHVAGYCGPMRGGPLGASEVMLRDDAGQGHRFQFETFFNGHDALTLGVHQGPRPILVAPF